MSLSYHFCPYLHSRYWNNSRSDEEVRISITEFMIDLRGVETCYQILMKHQISCYEGNPSFWAFFISQVPDKLLEVEWRITGENKSWHCPTAVFSALKHGHWAMVPISFSSFSSVLQHHMEYGQVCIIICFLFWWHTPLVPAQPILSSNLELFPLIWHRTLQWGLNVLMNPWLITITAFLTNLPDAPLSVWLLSFLCLSLIPYVQEHQFWLHLFS